MVEPPDADELGDELADGEPADAPLSGNAPLNLAEHVLARLSRRFRDRLTLEQVEALLGDLDLAERGPRRQAPLLRLLRLRFTGEKHLVGEEHPRPILYDQPLAPGVNVVLIEDNDVGKSSIMKTLKFALTGDDTDYDDDVARWIWHVWLTFSLEAQVYTVVLSRRGGLRAVLLLGEADRPVDEAADAPGLLWDVVGPEAVQSELRRFFFHRLGLSELSWTQQAEGSTNVAVGSTSWLTYFQALQILDDRYLLCDREHNYGHQEGLILSAFLGLRLAEPLNRLGVEVQRTRKAQRAEQVVVVEETQRVEAEVAGYQSQIQVARDAIMAISRSQWARRASIAAAPASVRRVAVDALLSELSIERRRLLETREELRGRIQQANAEARRLREAIQLRLHFTGLEVRVCPNCDGGVEGDAIRREEEEHLCRLCGRTPRSAPADELEAMEQAAGDAAARGAEDDRTRGALNSRIRVIDREIEQLSDEAAALQIAAMRNVDYALPTPEEEAEREQRSQEIGQLNARAELARSRLRARASVDSEAVDLRARVLEKARDILKNEASRLNTEILERLSALTQDIVSRIGADSISDIIVLPLGDVRFTKHRVPVTFGRLHNQGDRLRVKLAFFLAMVRLGRQPGLGRHPGLLLIDQPGAAEMVDADFAELARVFRTLDSELADEMQILCFTARSEFAEATQPVKVYGPRDDGYAF